MPSGRVHHSHWKKGLLLAVAAAVWLALTSQDWLLPLAALVGYISGRWLDPDLDQIGLTSAEGRLMRDLKLGGVIVTMWFLPYAYFMRFVGIGRKGHRNFFSHFPIVSTAIRMAWVLAIPAFFYLTTYGLRLSPPLASGLLGSFAGLSLADTLHYVADLTDRWGR